jgi:hypothetical protein
LPYSSILTLRKSRTGPDPFHSACTQSHRRRSSCSCGHTGPLRTAQAQCCKLREAGHHVELAAVLRDPLLWHFRLEMIGRHRPDLGEGNGDAIRLRMPSHTGLRSISPAGSRLASLTLLRNRFGWLTTELRRRPAPSPRLSDPSSRCEASAGGDHQIVVDAYLVPATWWASKRKISSFS